MKILVAMSGGVDSSVAALLLHRAGHEIVGMTLRVHDDAGKVVRQRSCCAPKDILDARQVAERLGIPYYAVDMREEFFDRVMKPFAEDYLAGKTPNPCVHCNSDLKFGLLFQRAKALGLDAVATGHFARVERHEGSGIARLLRGRDSDKDQSYFLFGLTQDQLQHAVFPLGDLTKEEVRAAARQAGLLTADKPESQEICFVPDGDYRNSLTKILPQIEGSDQTGQMLNTQGEVLAAHGGIHQFTVGQRKGLGITHPRPLYVVGINAPQKTVTVGEEAALYRDRMTVERVNWIAPDVEDGRLTIAIRYRHPAAWAKIQPVADHFLDIQFDEPQRAITPGQAAVFYRGDEVVGGGWIRA